MSRWIPNLITGLRLNVNILTSLVPTLIDQFIFCTLPGATKIAQCRTPAQSFWISKMIILEIQNDHLGYPKKVVWDLHLAIPKKVAQSS